MRLTTTQLRVIIENVLQEKSDAEGSSPKVDMQRRLLDVEDAIKTLVKFGPAVSNYLDKLNNENVATANDSLADEVAEMSFALKNLPNDLINVRNVVRTAAKAQKLSSKNKSPRNQSSISSTTVNKKLKGEERPGMPLSSVKVIERMTYDKMPKRVKQDAENADIFKSLSNDVVKFKIPGYGPSTRYGLVQGENITWFWDSDDGWNQL